MTDDADEIDSQLAAEIETRAVSRLKQLLIPKLQKECDNCNEAMAVAWQTIQTKMDEFFHEKRRIFTTLKAVEGPERANRVFHNELMNMKPKIFEEIVQGVMEAHNNPYKDNLPSPNTLPQASISEDFDRRSVTYDGDHPGLLEHPVTPAQLFYDDRLPEPSSSTAPVGVTNPGKRKRNTLENTSPLSSKKKGRNFDILDNTSPERFPIQPKHDPLDSWEVEGQDYVFQCPRAGPGWFVVRCNIGDPNYLVPVHFTEHPFKNDHAMNHFNGKGHSCHDASRHYEPDDIIREFGFRVENSPNEKELDEDWAANSNERTVREAAKNAAKGLARASKGKGKGKAKQSELTPANRTVLNTSKAPEADMGFYSDEGN